jgi:hypothetical protein
MRAFAVLAATVGVAIAFEQMNGNYVYSDGVNPGQPGKHRGTGFFGQCVRPRPNAPTPTPRARLRHSSVFDGALKHASRSADVHSPPSSQGRDAQAAHQH